MHSWTTATNCSKSRGADWGPERGRGCNPGPALHSWARAAPPPGAGGSTALRDRAGVGCRRAGARTGGRLLPPGAAGSWRGPAGQAGLCAALGTHAQTAAGPRGTEEGDSRRHRRARDLEHTARAAPAPPPSRPRGAGPARAPRAPPRLRAAQALPVCGALRPRGGGGNRGGKKQRAEPSQAAGEGERTCKRAAGGGGMRQRVKEVK
ncbi:Synaptojanin-1 [Manis pentadactyla]|nr:Synaptojanin-1 [Manis pentadactyla]